MEKDYKLIFDVESLSNGESVHNIANAVGGYQSAVNLFNETGDVEFEELAIDAERSLRILLTRLRFEHEAVRRWGDHRQM